MNTTTRMSAKGQIVIPKEVRDAMGWPAGTALEVVQGASSIVIRAPDRTEGKVDIDTALARIDAIVNYCGPRYDDSDWNASIDAMFRDGKDVTV
jgi:AbrB family looped-hinge helix DNA binding protein